MAPFSNWKSVANAGGRGTDAKKSMKAMRTGGN